MHDKQFKKFTAKIERYMRKGKLDLAVKDLTDAISNEPQDGRLYFMLGSVYQNDGAYLLAEKAYRSAERLSPDDPAMKWELAEFYVGLNRPEEGLPYVEFSAEEWPKEPKVMALLGRVYFQLARYAEALEALSKAIGLNPNMPDARAWIVELFEYTGQHELVRPAVEEYLRVAPSLVSSHVFMADYEFYENGDCIAAFPFYEKALFLFYKTRNKARYKPFFSTKDFPSSIVDSYTNALIECGLNDAAEAAARETFSKEELDAWRAVLYSLTGNYVKAEKYIRRALEAIPDASNWLYQSGMLRLRRGDFANSERDLRLAHQLSNEQGLVDVRILGGLVVAHQSQGNLEEAIQLQDLGEQRDASDLWTSMTYQNYFIQDWESTIRAGQRALEHDDHQRYVLQYIAEAQMNLGQIDEAISTYRTIIKFQPRNGRIWLALGKVYAKDGRIHEAIDTLQHASEAGMLSRVEEKDVRSRLMELQIQLV